METCVHRAMGQRADPATPNVDHVDSHVRAPDKLEGEKDRARGRVRDRGTEPRAEPLPRASVLSPSQPIPPSQCGGDPTVLATGTGPIPKVSRFPVLLDSLVTA